MPPFLAFRRNLSRKICRCRMTRLPSFESTQTEQSCSSQRWRIGWRCSRQHYDRKNGEDSLAEGSGCEVLHKANLRLMMFISFGVIIQPTGNGLPCKKQ